MSNVDSPTDEIEAEPNDHDRSEETTDPLGTGGLKKEEEDEESTRDADDFGLN